MVVFRTATPSDIEGIAGLHVTSWQQNYRGAFSDAFLDAEALIERRLVWQERLTSIEPRQFISVAEHEGAIVGFVCAYLNHSREYGTLLDNLHVASEMKGMGIGKSLMALVANESEERYPNSGLYLWVLEQNKKAHEFYTHLNGEKIETVSGNDIGDRTILKSRYFWSDIKTLLKRVKKEYKGEH
ncbi:GNAT family N-acetyltransferase [uncultured Kriegella sp.]|uniref:GNAT family N-acetyltransferase n=1 Tax=uncultured Kriegella sp. TaxID=1798910 RepID=UPI0030DDABDA|tara:strand:- start:15257 stop:15811 length:555 start_codon:yes stop_codon:yes gene_type:complete